MKHRFLLMMMVFCSTAMPAAERFFPFETEILNGCYTDCGIIRLHKELPSQEKAENVVIAIAA